MGKTISLFPYVGGKHRLVPALVEIVNECYDRYPIDTYIEPCGGGGRLILNLPRRGREIYSDWDRSLSNLFWAVSDEDRVRIFIDELGKIQNSKEWYTHIYNVYKMWNEDHKKPIPNPCQSAAYIYYLTYFGFNSRVYLLEELVGKHPNPSMKCPVGRNIGGLLEKPYSMIADSVRETMSGYTLKQIINDYHALNQTEGEVQE